MIRAAEIREMEIKSVFPSIGEISDYLDLQGTIINVDTINWKGFDYKPKVAISAAYTNHEILLKYYVTETYFKAEKTQSNDNVFEDSCVEFFVAPGTDGIYYNFEFNGIGTCLLGSGKERADRRRAHRSVISKIRILSSAGNKPVKEREGIFEWTITIAVPFEVFFHHNIGSVKGSTFMANFYKCGDKLKVPHYLTWNPVGTESPDFHKPEYFGELKFV